MMLWDFVRIGLAFVAGGLLLSAGIEDARTREIADWKSVALCALAPLWWWANAEKTCRRIHATGLGRRKWRTRAATLPISLRRIT